MSKSLVVHKPRSVGPTETVPTLRDLQQGVAIPIESLITALYVLGYTGLVTFDFCAGRPHLYALGQPRRGKIVSPS